MSKNNRLPSPFILTSWQNSFLELLLDCMLQEGKEGSYRDFSKLTFIVPHKRPQLYLMERLKKDDRFNKPCILPQIISAQELFPALREALNPRVTKTAKQLDMVALLLECIRQLPETNALFFRQSSSVENTEVLNFLPWGIRLASLFEECFTHNIEPENFLYEEYRVTQYAANLLAHIGSLFQLYVATLDEIGWTTPGYDACQVMRYLTGAGKLPEDALWHALHYKEEAKHKLFIAGFFALSGAENSLFHHLWTAHGAQILLQGDTQDTPHWSCEPLLQWARQWQASVERLPASTPEAVFSNVRFIAGFDLHSQLTTLPRLLPDTEPSTEPNKEPDTKNDKENEASTKRILGDGATPPVPQVTTEQLLLLTPQSASSSCGPKEEVNLRNKPATGNDCKLEKEFAADTVIVLPDTGLLMPTLHHLPRKDLNISMGYPLHRSSLFGLLDCLIQLQQNKLHGLYYWRDIVALIRHPYIKMLLLSPNSDEGERSTPDLTLRKILHRFEESLRKSNQVYIHPRQFFRQFYEGQEDSTETPPAVLHFLQRLERVLLNNFSAVTTPYSLARALHHFCKLLLHYGRRLWKQFPIDAECLFRLHSSLIPELSQTALSHENLSADVVFSLLRTLIEAERVPFEATPLVGLQLLGMLETRLLDFKKVIIPECTDDLLPGITIEDPLLPDPLRLEVGLPSKHKREELMAYHFYRLLAGAEEVVLLWQEGGQSSGLLDSRKRRSRFVEELIWQVEKKEQSLIPPTGGGPLSVLSTVTTPIHTKRSTIENTAPLHRAVGQFLTKPLSATALDSYLSCPTKFILRYILKVDESSEVTEGQDLPKIGTAIHSTLQTFYTPYLGRRLPEGRFFYENAWPELIHLFHSSQEYTEMKRDFSADVAALFATAGEIRLRNFLLNQPATLPLALEKTLRPKRLLLHPELECNIQLHGQADRIDIREGNIHILDYKTGGFVPEIRQGIWEDQSFWDEVAFWTPDTPKDPLPTLAKMLPSVQLPFYITLFQRLDESERQLLFGSEYTVFRSESVDNQGVTASWVTIGSDGCEKSLFTNHENYEYAESRIVENIEALLSFLTRHMLLTPSFIPHEGVHCAWCPYLGRCTALV